MGFFDNIRRAKAAPARHTIGLHAETSTVCGMDPRTDRVRREHQIREGELLLGALATTKRSQLDTVLPDVEVEVENLDRDADNRGLGGQRDLVGEDGVERSHLLVDVAGVHGDRLDQLIQVIVFPASAVP